MVYDLITYADKYILPDVFKTVVAHSKTLSADMPNGKILINGENLFVSIQDYASKGIAECKAETHRKYIDVQIVLAGSELIYWYPYNSLQVDMPYVQEKDVEFYHQPSTTSDNCGVALKMAPGMFALFLPTDIHMPQVMLLSPEKVKKAVYKIAVDSWR